MNVKREYAIDQVIEKERLGVFNPTIIRDRDNEERAVIITGAHLYVIQASPSYNRANVTRTAFDIEDYSHFTVFTGADVAIKPAAPRPKAPCYCDSAYHPQGC